MRLIGRTTALVAAVILSLLTFSGAHASAVPAGDFPDGLNFGGLQRNRLLMAASQSIYALYVNTQGVSYF